MSRSENRVNPVHGKQCRRGIKHRPAHLLRPGRRPGRAPGPGRRDLAESLIGSIIPQDPRGHGAGHGRGWPGHRHHAAGRAGPDRPGRQVTAGAGSGPPGQRVRQHAAFYRSCGLGSVPGWAGRGSPSGWARKDASCRSRGHSRAALGAGTPGRSLGTTTRSARGRMAHRTGAVSRTVSPSMPTGICGASASTVTSPAVSVVSPWPCPRRRSPAACRALSTRTATTPSVPASSRARRPGRPCRSSHTGRS